MKNTMLFLLLLMPLSIWAQAKREPVRQELPLHVPEPLILPLRDLVDQKLQGQFTRKLNSNKDWKKLIQEKKMAVGLVDLKDPFHIRFARVNGNEMMYAASLPKIAILLAAMEAIDVGELEDTPEIQKELRLMISQSDNQASTRMIDRLGYGKIEEVLTNSDYGLYDEDYGGGLWVGKRYAASGARYPDPIKGLSHAATVSQVCRYYYMLAMGKLVNYDRSKQMLNYMVDPELHHKFVHTLDELAPEANIYRKSGSWRDFHSDSVLVWGKDPNRRYILVALIQDGRGESIIRELVNVAEEILNLKR